MSSFPLFVLRAPSVAILLSAFFVLVSETLAQPTRSPSSRADRAVAYQEAHAASATLFQAGNVVQAETALLRVNFNRKGTVAWHVEAAQRLYSMAVYLRARGDDAALQAGERALRQLDQAEAKSLASGDSKGRAKAKALAGVIYERFFQDSQTALQRYREAAEIDPIRNATAVARLELIQNARTQR